MTEQGQHDGYEQMSREELVGRVRELERRAESGPSKYSRRKVLGGVAAAAGVGALAAYGADAATGNPTGTFPVTTDDPLLKIRADRIELVGRTSDPATPVDGTLWYRSDI